MGGTSTFIGLIKPEIANRSSGSAFVTNLSTTAFDGTGARQCIDGLG